MMLELDWPARAVIDGDCISIRVPISALVQAFQYCPAAPRDNEGNDLYRVTDAEAFAKSVAHRLNDEEEDGATLIHRMLDAAMIEALEQGDEGVVEIGGDA